MKVLLGPDNVSPDNLDGDDRTPPSNAARNGYEGVVNTLLRQEEVNPDK